MSPFSVFIDTSALPRNPAHLGAGYERLIQLVNNNVVTVYLAEVVVEEWASQMKEGFLETINSLDKSLRKSLRHIWFTDWPPKNSIMEAYDQLSKSKVDIDQFTQAKYIDLLKQINAITVPIQDDHGKSVINSYFSGLLPFRAVKSREDFPDAFIFEALKDLLEEQPVIHFIGADKGLKAAAAQFEDIAIYTDIDSFVTSDAVLEQVHLDEAEKCWSYILELIRSKFENYYSELNSALEVLLLDELPGKTIHHEQIPDDNGDACIVAIGEPTDVDLDPDKFINFGPGILTFPFNCLIDTEVDFFIYRGDAFDPPLGVWVVIGDFEKDYYFDAGGTLSLEIEGELALKFDLSDLDEQGLPALMDVDIENIKEITVVEDDYEGIFHRIEDTEIEE